MDRLKWITHKGQKIAFADYTNLKVEEEFISIIKEVTEKIITDVGKNGLAGKTTLVLTDVRDSVVGSNVVNSFKSYGQKIEPYIKKNAVVGIQGIRKILLDAINKISGIGVKPFPDIEQAKDWLVG